MAYHGQGTTNEVATSLVKSDICLGIVPLGSGNGRHLAVEFPKTLKRHLQLLEMALFFRWMLEW